MACCVLMAALFAGALSVFRPRRRGDAQGWRLETRQ